MKLKHLLPILSVALLLCGPLAAKPGFGTPELLVDGWKFKLEKDGIHTIAADADFSRWQTVNLPHDWSVEGPCSPDKASATGYLPGGSGWYAKSFIVPAEKQGEKVYVYFEGIYNRSQIYLNGHLVGGRPNGYISFLCDLTPHIRFGSENVLRVHVDHTRYNDSRWYTGSGIYRDVYLVYAHPVHTGLWGTYCRTEKATKSKADLRISTTLLNESPKRANAEVRLSIEDLLTKKVVAASSKKVQVEAGDTLTCEQTLKIARPNFWSVDEPNLYKVTSRIYIDGRHTETVTLNTGVRNLTFDPDKGFALNGQWMKIKGVCLHHDAGCLGAAVPREVWKRRLSNLKKLGCNGVRMSHNPQSTDVYDICDEIGLLVIDEAFDEWEFPKRKWVEGWNVGTPTYDGNFDFFEEWSERDLRDMVLRDRNHPSIIMWSIGNEVDYPNDPYSHPSLDRGTISQPVQGGYMPERPSADRLSGISKRLAQVVRRHDSTRPVTAALAGVIMSNHTDYPFNIDVCGYNYTEDRYEADHAAYPKRIIYGSENRHDLAAWKAVRDHEYIFAQFIWTGTDYLGESGRWPSRGFHTGLLDFGSFIKPRGYFRRVMWAEEPVSYIGTYPTDHKRLSEDAWSCWNYTEGDTIRVVSYTNTPFSRLLLNGKQVGDTQAFNEATFISAWDIPFRPGELKVEGLSPEGKVLTSYSIHTSGRPAAIKATPYVVTLDKTRGVCQIEIEITDENGRPVILSDDEITCRTEGPVRLLGLESSDNTDMGNFRDNRQRVYKGRLLAYIQATGTTGDAQVSFSSPWLEGTTVKLNIK